MEFHKIGTILGYNTTFPKPQTPKFLSNYFPPTSKRMKWNTSAIWPCMLSRSARTFYADFYRKDGSFLPRRMKSKLFRVLQIMWVHMQGWILNVCFLFNWKVISISIYLYTMCYSFWPWLCMDLCLIRNQMCSVLFRPEAIFCDDMFRVAV